MSYVRVTTRIRAPRDQVWTAVRDIASHVEWMADAESIHFVSAQREGVGTTFDCRSRLGPLRLTDRMVVTEWDEGWVLGIRHAGAVTGVGRFTLEPVRLGRHTLFTWEETLRFPWWMGGRFGAGAARPFFVRVWKGNLRRLRRSIEGPSLADRLRDRLRGRGGRQSSGPATSQTTL